MRLPPAELGFAKALSDRGVGRPVEGLGLRCR